MTDSELMAYLDEVEGRIDRDMYDPDMTLELEAKYEHWREVSKKIHALHPAKMIEPIAATKWGKTVKVKLDNTRRFYYSHDMGVGFIWVNEISESDLKPLDENKN